MAFCPKDGARLSAALGTPELIGTIIADRYRITSKIGGGGMGQVYKAEHVRMRRTCAIKVLRGGLTDDPEAIQRFQREAENASQISHPNVAQIYDFGEHERLVYLAMEFIEGESLADLLGRQAAVHPDVAADIISQAAAALDAAHARGVMHRDVKPDNIMLAKHADGTYLVKLVDFGIAREMTREEQRVTRTGLVIGTPEYMSPEQLSGEPIDARSDLYALALVAFQSLTGQQAFPNTSSKQNLILRLTSKPRTLAEVREDVPWPESLQAVFDRALASDPHDRYATTGAFAEALWDAIGAMAPSQTAELYRKALDQRVLTSVPRTPSVATAQTNAPSASTRAAGATAPMPSAAAKPTVATPTVQLGSPTQTATPLRPSIPVAPYRRRRSLLPWLIVIGVGGYGYIKATGRTAEALALVESLKEKVTEAIGGPAANGSRDATPDAPREPARAERSGGGTRRDAPRAAATPDAGNEPAAAVPPPSSEAAPPPATITPPDTLRPVR
ncbi:MAG: protein kinase [Gemmatimonadaceae bacterium]|nr:protein kinase [Gemmatimonadaceae bacterium]